MKLKTLNKLIDNHLDTEKKITAMDLTQILAVPGITVPEIHIITELQSAIKARKVIAYLSEGTDEAEAPANMESGDETAKIEKTVYEDTSESKEEEHEYRY
jgi:hypothetical protein